jgi:NitT/TauT family transport system substrate-binding protein
MLSSSKHSSTFSTPERIVPDSTRLHRPFLNSILTARLLLQFITLLLLPGIFAPAFALAQSIPKVSVAYAAISPVFAGVWMAKEIGAFEKQGLKSDLVYISSGSITVQAMVGGNLDMSIAASNAVISAILHGAPLIAVGSITNRPAMSLFVQSEISRPEQLQGKTLAITRHGSSTHFLTLFMLEKLGLQDKVKIQPMGGTREVDAAIRSGMVAGAVRSMKPGPKTRMLVDLPDLGIPFSMDLIAVKRDFYRNSPRTVEAMLKAYVEGVAALRTRKELAYKVMGKYMLGASDSLDEAYEYAVKYLDRQARVDPAVIQTVLNWENKSDTPVTEFFDNTIIDRIQKEGFIDRLYK